MFREAIARYFLRMGLAMPETVKASPELLREMHNGHCRKIPVENLDAINRLAVSLDPGDVYRKVIDRKRGGSCFELNALFGWLLRELGYRVEDRAARYLRGESGYPMRNHSVLCVADLEGAVWFCDVGAYGESPLLPLRLEEDTEQTQGNRCFRFRKHRVLGWRLEEKLKDGWDDILAFTDEPQLPQDFLALSYYMNNAPESPFSEQVKISIKAENGRLQLEGNILTEFCEGEPISSKEYSNEELPQVYSRFGLRYE